MLYIQKDRQTEAERQTEGPKDIHTDIRTDIWTDRQTDRQRGRQTPAEQQTDQKTLINKSWLPLVVDRGGNGVRLDEEVTGEDDDDLASLRES